MMLIVLWDPHVAMEAANREKAADVRMKMIVQWLLGHNSYVVMTFALQRILTLRTIVHVKKTKIVLTRLDLYVAMENVLFQTYFQLMSVHAKLTTIARMVTFVVMGNAKSLKNVHARTEKIVQRARHAVMDNV